MKNVGAPSFVLKGALIGFKSADKSMPLIVIEVNLGCNNPLKHDTIRRRSPHRLRKDRFLGNVNTRNNQPSQLTEHYVVGDSSLATSVAGLLV